MKYFVISDIHNCYDLLVNALNENGFDINNNNHMIIFLGDAFDKGPTPVETYLYLKELHDRNKLIWIRGNHDTENIQQIEHNKLSDTCLAIAKYYGADINDGASVSKCLIENGVYDLLLKSIDYYETTNYIFTHGFLPNKDGVVLPNWREIKGKIWEGFTVRKGNGVRSILKNGSIGKTLVCGHVGAYYGNMTKAYPNVELDSPEFNKLKNKFSKDPNNFKAFLSKDVINVDANGYKNGFFNCIVIED